MEGIQSIRQLDDGNQVYLQDDANSFAAFQQVSGLPHPYGLSLTFHRTHPQGKHRGEVEDAIRKLDVRLHEALAHSEEIRRKRELPLDGATPMSDAKRIKTSADSGPSASTPRPHHPVDPAILANFDFSTVPKPVLIDIVVESLKLLSEEQLKGAIEVNHLLLFHYIALF